jgi:hypothetical protein
MWFIYPMAKIIKLVRFREQKKMKNELKKKCFRSTGSSLKSHPVANLSAQPRVETQPRNKIATKNTGRRHGKLMFNFYLFVQL